MCLLVVLHRVIDGAPLVVAANRDEMLARAAVPMTVLREREPRVVGGRDEVAGGTWLAASERGVVAGLTNLPNPSRDRTKRSRGELPLALAAHPSARAAVGDFEERFRPSDFNPAWLLAGDREALFYVDMTSGGDRPGVRELAPGVHVLENHPLGAASAKVTHVARALAGIESLRGDALVARLHAVLRDHDVPTGVVPSVSADGLFTRPLETYAACVHAGPYGTRSAEIAIVGEGEAPPSIWFTDGPPCTAPLQRAAWGAPDRA